MSSLKSVDGILRPLLHLPKNRLKEYAVHNDLAWNEDSTNENLTYRRNYIRNVLLPNVKRASPAAHERLKHIIRRQAELNRAIDESIGTILHVQPARTRCGGWISSCCRMPWPGKRSPSGCAVTASVNSTGV